MRSFAFQRVLTATLFVFALAGCTPAASPSPAATSAPAQPKSAAPAAPTAAPKAAAPSGKPSGQAAVEPLSPRVTLKVGTIGSASDSGNFIAIDRGYFEELGLDIDLVQIDGGSRMMPALSTGQIEVAAGGTSAGLFNAVASGVPLRVIADKGSLREGFGFQAMMVRKELIDSGQVEEMSDLKGLRIAVNAVSSIDSYFLTQALEQGGLTLEDVEPVEMPFPDMIAALASGGVDAATLIEPFVTRAEEIGAAVAWKRGDEIAPGAQIAVIMINGDYAQQNQEVVRRYALAYLKGVRDYNDAFVKNQGKDEVIEILTRFTAIKDPDTFHKIVPAGLNPNGEVNAEIIDEAQELWVELGFIQNKIDIDRVVDHQYVRWAVEQLGPYQ